MQRGAISSLPSAQHPTRSVSATIEALPQGSNAPVEKRMLAGARRVAGFRRQRAVPYPQRSRQCPIPHQRRDAARRRHWLRQRSRHRPDRQHLAHYRRAAGRISGCAPSALLDITTRTDIFNNSGSVSYYGGSRGTIEPSFEYGGTRSARTAPRPRQRRDAKPPSSACLGGVQYFVTGQLPADHRGHRKSAADAQRDPRFLVAGKRLRLRLDVHRPLYAPDLDGGNGHQQFSDSQRA